MAADTVDRRMYRKQGEAVVFAYKRYQDQLRGSMLAMDMGTGKTRCAIEYCKLVNEDTPKGSTLVMLIACPLVLLPDPKALRPGGWAGEFRKWWPDVDLFAEIKGTTTERAQRAARVCQNHANGGYQGMPLAIAASYESWRQPAMRDLATAILKTRRFRTVFIMDESHRAKSPKGSRSLSTNGSFCRSVASRALSTLLLTGTPMPHGPEDLWSQMYCVNPEAYGDSWFWFRSKYFNCRDINNVKVIVSLKKDFREEFYEKYHDNAFTCTIDEVTDLPGISQLELPVSLNADEWRAYDNMEKNFFARIPLDEGGYAEITAPNVLAQMMKLSQVTGGSIKRETGETLAVGSQSSKAKAVMSVIEDMPIDEPVVIFCRFLADIDTLAALLPQLGRQTYELSGRRKETEPWRSGGAGEVLLVQESAGGIGVDLSRARYAFFYSVNYSYGDLAQAIARIYRKGQTRKCVIYHVVAKGTIDETIREAILRKEDVVNAVLGRGGFKTRRGRPSEGDETLQPPDVERSGFGGAEGGTSGTEAGTRYGEEDDGEIDPAITVPQGDPEAGDLFDPFMGE